MIERDLAALPDNRFEPTRVRRARRFRDVAQVRATITRIRQDNLRETTTELVGELRGVLPDSRMFELKLEGAGQLVRGKVGPGVADPAALQPLVHKLVRMPVLVTQVGVGRPRYVLAGEPTLAGPTAGG